MLIEELLACETALWFHRCDMIDMLAGVPGEQKYPSPELVSLPFVSRSVSVGVPYGLFPNVRFRHNLRPTTGGVIFLSSWFSEYCGE